MWVTAIQAIGGATKTSEAERRRGAGEATPDAQWQGSRSIPAARRSVGEAIFDGEMGEAQVPLTQQQDMIDAAQSRQADAAMQSGRESMDISTIRIVSIRLTDVRKDMSGVDYDARKRRRQALRINGYFMAIYGMRSRRVPEMQKTDWKRRRISAKHANKESRPNFQGRLSLFCLDY